LTSLTIAQYDNTVQSNIYGVQNGDLGVEYPKSDGNGSLSDASTIPKDDQAPVEVFDGAVEHHQTKIPQLERALAVVREFCAIGMESEVAEDGRQALEHTRAVQMVLYNLREKGIQIVRVVLASFGIFAANMVDINAMGIPDPEGHSRHTDDWRSGDGKTESKASAYCTF
jgi:hypothetical protein